jgi:type I restriction enzyme S subunit
MQPGFACQPTDDLGGLPQLRTNNVSADGRIDLAEIKRVPRAAAEIKRYSLTPGDILFNNTNSPALVGKTAFFEEPGEYAFSNHMTRIRIDDRLAAPQYVARFLHWAWTQGAFRTLVTQWVNQAAINRSQLASVTVPLPPLSEQRRIVGILNQADGLRRLRAEAGTKAGRIVPALFLKMFGDPATNPMGWPVRTLGELAILGPEYGANARAIPLSAGQPRYVRITDIDQQGRLRPLDAVGIDLGEWEQYKLEGGDLLFARSGATVGKTYLHRSESGPCVFAGYLIRFRLDPTELHPLVAFGFAQTMAYRAWVGAKRRTAAQPNINGQEYASLRLPVPARSAQEHFASLCSSIEAVRHALSSSSDRLELLFSVLCRRAFDGDLTASWREAHMNELLQEMEQQAQALAGSGSR